MAGAGSSLSVRWHEGDACLFVCVGVRSGSAVAGSSGTVGGGSGGDGDLLLVVDKAVERAGAVSAWGSAGDRCGLAGREVQTETHSSLSMADMVADRLLDGSLLYKDETDDSEGKTCWVDKMKSARLCREEETNDGGGDDEMDGSRRRISQLTGWECQLSADGPRTNTQLRSIASHFLWLDCGLVPPTWSPRKECTAVRSCISTALCAE